MPKRNSTDVPDDILAAIDVGTNAVRHVLARVQPDGAIETLHQERDPVRPGEGLFKTGIIKKEVADRLLATLHALRLRPGRGQATLNQQLIDPHTGPSSSSDRCRRDGGLARRREAARAPRRAPGAIARGRLPPATGAVPVAIGFDLVRALPGDADVRSLFLGQFGQHGRHAEATNGCQSGYGRRCSDATRKSNQWGQGPGAGQGVSEAARAQAKLGTRLASLIESTVEESLWDGYTGRKLSHSAPERLSRGDLKIFLKKEETAGTNTAVALLVDYSGSMWTTMPLTEGGSRAAGGQTTAQEAAYETHFALASVLSTYEVPFLSIAFANHVCVLKEIDEPLSAHRWDDG